VEKAMRLFLAPALVACALLAVSEPCAAQGIFGKLKDKAKQRVDRKTDSATDKALDKVASAVACAITDKACIKQAHDAGKPIQVVDSKGHAVSSADSAAAISAAVAEAANVAASDPSAPSSTVALSRETSGGAAESQPPGAGAWLNYDFVPGDKVLFFDDFAGDNVGDLPKHEDVTNGNATVVDVNGQKYFRTTTGADFWIELPEALPQRFTIEATYHNASGGHPLTFHIGADADKGMDVWCYQDQAGVEGQGANGGKNSSEDAKGINKNDFVNCRFMFDGGYVKAYINEQRLGQLNGLVFARTKKIKVSVPGSEAEKGGTLVTNIRVAAGGKKLWDALSTTGRASTHGILFDTGSDRIRPESTPTLKEIGDMLKSHPDLKLTIEGHTDNVGAAAANQTLSDKRAAAVKQYLVSTYGIDAARLATKGFGSSKPVASNDTPEGRQNNRRVELVKM
jgi:outer membrane protein OmpA-like peptidoglycan-associated protein